jgi:hypothetical protein
MDDRPAAAACVGGTSKCTWSAGARVSVLHARATGQVAWCPAFGHRCRVTDLDFFVDVVVSGGVLGVGLTESPEAVAQVLGGDFVGGPEPFDFATRLWTGRVLLVAVAGI